MIILVNFLILCELLLKLREIFLETRFLFQLGLLIGVDFAGREKFVNCCVRVGCKDGIGFGGRVLKSGLVGVIENVQGSIRASS